MNNLTLNIVQTEELEMKLHKARLNLLSFPSLAMECFDKGYMTESDFMVLNEAVKASDSLEYALTLNKMTILFNQNKVA
jgi:hypothetical protein